MQQGKSPGKGNPIQASLRSAAEVYRDFLKDRYIRFSQGEGDWPDIVDETRKRKKRRTPGTEDLILRETDTILDRITIRRIKNIHYVGVFSTAIHPYSKISVTRLTEIHADPVEAPGGKVRKVIAGPDRDTQFRMRDLVRKGVSTAVSQVNKENARGR